MSFRAVAAVAAGVIVLSVAVAPGASAAAPKPAKHVCSVSGDAKYACMGVADMTVPSGDTATFTGDLSATALKNLHDWTAGDDIVCLTRYKTTPEADGSWPWKTLEGACTTVRKDGGFTINAEFGRKGTYFYGLEMGPCRGSAGLCGNGDGGLIGVGSNRKDKVLSLTTT
jgi:hypothetical protein